MFGIFMESFVIFKLYTGLKLLLGLALLMWLYLLVAEKEKNVRTLLVWAPILVVILFLCPVSRKIFVAAGLDGETYYRIIWTIPMGVIYSYGVCRLLAGSAAAQWGSDGIREKIFRRIGLALAALLVVFCGSLVYRSSYITKAENLYHIPDTVIRICDRISPEGPEERVSAVMPPELIHFVRQYDARINMPYGREMLVERWGYYNRVYEAMEKPEVVAMEELLEATREEYCSYIVMAEERAVDQDPQECGLLLLDEIDGYLIYEDPVTVQTVEQWQKDYGDEG